MKKLVILLSCVLLSAYAVGLEIIKVGASPIPHAQMLEFVRPLLIQQGYDLEIIQYYDYVLPNLALRQGKIDANFFQHIPYLEEYNKEHDSDLVPLVKVHIEPMGVYANNRTNARFISSKKVSDIKVDSTVGIPDDRSDQARALRILAHYGVITLESNIIYPQIDDVISNPLHLQITAIDPTLLTRRFMHHHLDLAIINTNVALENGLNPIRDAVLSEGKNSPYANVIVVRRDELNEPSMHALAKAMTSPQMKEFINKTYGGAIVPAF